MFERSPDNKALEPSWRTPDAQQEIDGALKVVVFRKTTRYQAQRPWHPNQPVAPDEQRPAIPELRGLRKFVIVGDLDSGELKLRMITLYGTKRVDSYAAFFDGVRWTPRVHGRIRKTVGWSLALDGLRRAIPRMHSMRNAE